MPVFPGRNYRFLYLYHLLQWLVWAFWERGHVDIPENDCFLICLALGSFWSLGLAVCFLSSGQ